MVRHLVLSVILLAFSVAIGNVRSQEKSASSSISSLIPNKLRDATEEQLRQQCMELFPELRKDDPEATTIDAPDVNTTTPEELAAETTTEQPSEPSSDDATITTTEGGVTTTTEGGATTTIEGGATTTTEGGATTTIEGGATTTTEGGATTTTEGGATTTTESGTTTTTESATEPPTTVPTPELPKNDDETTPIPPPEMADSPTTTTETPEKLSTRQGKQLDIPEANLVKDASPNPSTDDLIKLIKDLTRKIENLEATQRALYENIDDLQKKLENTPQVMKQKETVANLASGDPQTAIDNWKDLAQNVSSPDELGNVTKGIVEEAIDQGASPTGVMDFVNEIPNPTVQETCYGAISDKVNGSEKVQEELYWKDMTPYCQQAAQNIGPNNPSTIKMYDVQNQVRLNACRPIAMISSNIQYQQYQPAVFQWLTMVRDIPDSPPQLEANMQRMMLKTYAGNPANLPFAFHFILILPHNQGYFKQVAYKCLTQEMKANGHYYDPNAQQQLQRQS